MAYPCPLPDGLKVLHSKVEAVAGKLSSYFQQEDETPQCTKDNRADAVRQPENAVVVIGKTNEQDEQGIADV